MKQPNLSKSYRTLARVSLVLFAATILLGATAADAKPTVQLGSQIDINDNQSTNVFSNATITDTNDVSVSISFTPTTLGGFATLPSGITGSAGNYSIALTNAADATDLLKSLKFVAISNYIPVSKASNVTFTVSASETNGGPSSDSVTLHISALNDSPTLSVTGSTSFAITDKGTVQPFTGVTVADVDNGGAQSLTLTVRVANTNVGSISIGTSGFVDNSPIYTFSGTSSAANTAIHKLVYVPVENRIPVGQTDTNNFTVAVSDGDLSVTNSSFQVVATSTNDTPVIDGLSSIHSKVKTGTAYNPFATTTLRDPDANTDISRTNGQSLSLKVVLSGAAPLGQLQSGGFSGTTYEVTGLDQLAATEALRGVSYRAPSLAIAGTNPVTMTITLDDGNGGKATNSAFADIYSDVSPAGLTGTQAGQRVNDNTSLPLFSAVSIQSFNGSSVTVKISLTNDIQGQLINLSGFVKNTSTSPAVYEFTGSSEAATAAIRSLLFRPTENRINGSSEETSVFGITLIDGPLTNSPDFSTTVIVTPVNDAPTMIGFSPLVTISDLETVHPFPTVLIGDVDELGAQPLTVTISLDNPLKGSFATNSLGGFVKSGSSYIYQGTNASAAIRQLVFVPTPNRVSVGLTETTTFGVTVDDSHGGTVVNNATAIRVASVSGMPVVNLPAPQPLSVPFNANIFPFQLVTITDPNLLNVGIRIANTSFGSFTPASLTASGFVDRGGGLYTFSGSASNSTAALQQLNFSPDANIPVGAIIYFGINVTNQVPNSISTNLAITLRQIQKAFIVTKLTDYDPTDSSVPDTAKFGTLRKAIEDAGGNDHVTFDIRSTVVGSADYPATIRLKKTLVLNNNLVVDGPGAERLTISGDTDGDGNGEVQLFVVNSAVTMNRLTFTKGKASFSGGAFEVNEAGSLTLSYCALTDNTADVWGGAVDVNEGVLNVDHCLFSGNQNSSSLGQGGGAISIYTSQSCLIANSTFSRNAQLAVNGYGGGALYVENLDPGTELDVAVAACTFRENTDAANQGTSIRPNVFNTHVWLQNSVLADGKGKNIDMDHTGTVLSLGGNISDDATTTTFSTGGEPVNTIIFHPPTDWTNATVSFSALTNNGGPTLTYALSATNIAINHSVSNTPASPFFSMLGTDQRGFFRDGQPDIGAFELGASNRIIIEEIHFAPANTNDEFIEFYVPRDSAGFDVAGYKVFVGGNLRHVFTSQFVAPGEALVLFPNDSSTTSVPTGVHRQVASGKLSLDDVGGRITVKSPTDQVVFEVNYVGTYATSDPDDFGYLSAANQSIVLSPQFEGVFLPYQRVVAKEGGRVPATNELSGAGYNVNGNPLAPGNAPPRAYADSVATTANVALPEIAVLTNDVDLDVNDTIRVVGVGVTNGVTPGVTDSTSNSALGALISISADGKTISYDPTASAILTALPQGSNVVDTFQYTILDSLNGVDHDRGGDSSNNIVKATGTVTISVTGVNSAPTPQDDTVSTTPSLTTPEDVVLDFKTAATILANDLDPNSDDDSSTLTMVAVQPTAVPATSVQTVSALGANVSLDIRFDRNETHITYDPRGSSVLNALGQGQTAVDTFYYTVADRYGALGTAAIHITVTGVNDPVRAVADSTATDEDTAIAIPATTLLANDLDDDNGTLFQVTAVTATSALGANVQIVGTNVVYDPTVSSILNALARKEIAIDTFTYTASDGFGSLSNAVVSVTVTGVNDKPVPAADQYTTGEKELLAIASPGLLGNDLDYDVNGSAPDDLMRVVPSTNLLTLEGATASINTDGTFSYDPRGRFDWLKQDELLTDTFSYTVSDHSFTIANNDLFNVASGSSNNVLPVLANDVSLSQSGAILSVVGVSAASGSGTVSTTSNAIVYTPADNFVGTETFIYTISDGQGGTDTALVTVKVSGSAPIANPDSFTVAIGTSANLNVLANDTILPATGAGLTITAIGATDHGGSVVLNGNTVNNSITYTPNPANAAPFTETFSYQISNGGAVQATGIVSVLVIDRSNLLTKNDDSFVVIAGGGNNVLDVLANDQILPLSNTNLVITSFQATGVSGTVSLNTNHTRLLYRPAIGLINHQEPLISYTISDGVGGTATANVSVKVRQSGFFAEDDVFSVMKNSSSNSLSVTLNDIILPNAGQTITISGIGIDANAPDKNGTVTISGNGKALVYTPATDFVGEETFTYEISDGTPARALGHVRVKVLDNSAVNSHSDVYNVARNSLNNLLAPLRNDYVLPRSIGSLKITSLLTNGLVGTASLSGNAADNTISYTPATGFIGHETFACEITDLLGNKVTNSVTVNVDGLLTAHDEFTVLSDSSANALDVLANDYLFPDPTRLRNISGVGAGDHGGTITTNSTANGILYSPAPGYVGAERFDYQIKNDSGDITTQSAIVRVVAVGSDRDTKTVTITVVGTNDLPTVTGVQSGIQITDKQTTQPFANVIIGDLDEHGLQPLKISVSFDGATGALTNLSGFAQSSSGVYVFQGTGAQITTAIRQLRFVPVENRIPVPTTEVVRFTISLDDNYVSSPVVNDVTTVEVTAADDAPVIRGTIAGETVYQYSSIRPFAGVVVSDVDDLGLQPLRVTVKLSASSHGNFTSLENFVNTGNGTYQLTSATPAAATLALQNLVFVPTTGGRVSPGTPEVTGFTVTVEDNFASPVIDNVTTVSAIHEFSTKILANDGLDNDQFGAAVAALRDVAIIGAPFDNNERGLNAGAAYVYVRQPATEQWTQLQKVVAGDGTANDQFGAAVAIDGDTFVVGARFDPGLNGSGAAFVFRRTSSNSWAQVAKLSPFDGVNNDQFGYAVSISGDVVAVGSRLDDANGSSSGSAYLFGRNQGGTNKWGLIKKVVAADGASGDQFGSTLRVRGDILAVGAPLDVQNGTSSGSVYLFNRTQGGTNNWGQIKKLVASDAANGDHFGSALGLNGTNLVVGASEKSLVSDNIGAAYVFSRDIGGANNWGQVKKLLPPTADLNDQFGTSISIYQDKIIAGTPFEGPGSSNKEFGLAYLFGQNQNGVNNWGFLQSVDRSDPNNNDLFGYDVVISSNTVVIGVPLDDDNGSSSGSAYIYRTKYNNAPVVATGISNLTVSAGAAFSFAIPQRTFADVDILDTLTFAAFTSGGPAWLNFDSTLGVFSGTPDAVGQYTISVVATDEDGASVTNSFALNVVPSFTSSLQTWRERHFGAAAADPSQEATWGDSADPDGDGNSNWLEYLFGTNPLDANDSGLKISAQADGTFIVSYCGHSVITYTLEASTDLVNWSSGNVIVQEKVSTPMEDDLEKITCQVIPANPGNTTLFFRLSVAQ